MIDTEDLCRCHICVTLPSQRFTWSAKPKLLKPGYECSTQGDPTFSAFHARVPTARCTIEQMYQTKVKGYRSIKEGKGKKPLLVQNTDELMERYLELWELWAAHNEEKIRFLHIAATACGYHLTDTFARGPVSQAHALCIILNRKYGHD